MTHTDTPAMLSSGDEARDFPNGARGTAEGDLDFRHPMSIEDVPIWSPPSNLTTDVLVSG